MTIFTKCDARIQFHILCVSDTDEQLSMGNSDQEGSEDQFSEAEQLSGDDNPDAVLERIRQAGV